MHCASVRPAISVRPCTSLLDHPTLSELTHVSSTPPTDPGTPVHPCAPLGSPGVLVEEGLGGKVEEGVGVEEGGHGGGAVKEGVQRCCIPYLYPCL